MENFKLQITLLTDTLEKKKGILTQISNITENQEALLKSQDTDDVINQLFEALNEEKQKLIDDVINADNFFQRTFSDIGPEFEEKSQLFKEMIQIMQNLIREVMDLDVKIRVQEQHNKTYALKSINRKKAARPTVSKNYILDQYKKNTNAPD